jgi:hypothetical protein
VCCIDLEEETRGSGGLYSGVLELCGEKCGGVKPLRLVFTER